MLLKQLSDFAYGRFDGLGLLRPNVGRRVFTYYDVLGGNSTTKTLDTVVGFGFLAHRSSVPDDEGLLAKAVYMINPDIACLCGRSKQMGDEQRTEFYEECSVATQQMRASAHVNPLKVLFALNERDEDEITADTPEFFFDVDAVRDELKAGRRRERVFNVIMAAISVIIIATIVSLLLDEGDLADRIAASVFSLLLLVLAALAVYWRDYLVFRYIQNTDLSRVYRPLDHKPSNHRQNVVVASGDNPFVGYGLEYGSWSFVIDLKDNENGNILPASTLPIDELYDEISERIDDLGIEGAEQQDQLFCNGSDISGMQDILPDPHRKPMSVVRAELVNQYLGANSDEIRHYRVFRFPGWRGDFVFSAFFRATSLAHGVYLEGSYRLLPPIKKKLRGLDLVPDKMDLKQHINLFIRSVARAPYLLVRCAVYVLYRTPLLIAETLKGDVPSADDALAYKVASMADYKQFNYGASCSLRELFSERQPTRFFQIADADKYSKIFIKETLTAIEGSLDRRGIDTSDFKERGTTILNHGLVVTGGKVNAGAVAVGPDAKAGMQRVKKAVRRS